jgi:hypothetical protein
MGLPYNFNFLKKGVALPNFLKIRKRVTRVRVGKNFRIFAKGLQNRDCVESEGKCSVFKRSW